jgi:hypothetical protein
MKDKSKTPTKRPRLHIVSPEEASKDPAVLLEMNSFALRLLAKKLGVFRSAQGVAVWHQASGRMAHIDLLCVALNAHSTGVEQQRDKIEQWVAALQEEMGATT